MTLCPNSTNKLILETEDIKGRTVYFAPNAEVSKIIAQGGLPDIALKDYNFLPSAPKIAVLMMQDARNSKDYTEYSMSESLLDSIILSGGKPCFITYEKPLEQLKLIAPDGILLPGGNFDVPSEFELNPNPVSRDLTRYNAYHTMLEYAKQNKLPLLAICGGMQVLACNFGAKLTNVSNHKTGLSQKCDKVILNPLGLLPTIIKSDEFLTNSMHSWAVSPDNFGNNLVHFSSDGVIEAIEPLNKWHNFVLGIQSHPEYFVKEGYAPAVNIFSAFIKASKDNIK